MGLSSQKGIGCSDMRGSKLSVQYQPDTRKEVREFLRAARFCQIWIPGFPEITKPLFKATAGSGKGPLEWGPEQEKAFKENRDS